MKKCINVAVVGAESDDCQLLLNAMEAYDLPIERLYLFSIDGVSNNLLYFNGNMLTIAKIAEKSFEKPIDIAFFIAGEATSKKYAPLKCIQV